MVTVSAVSGSVTGNAPFHIDPPTPTGLVISPASSSVLIGSGQPSKLSAILSFTDQSTQDISGDITRRSEEHTSELQSPDHLVCRLLLEKKKKKLYQPINSCY